MAAGFKLYGALGVGKDAPPDEIKRAYRRMAVKHHPDKGGDPDTFSALSEAYEVLCDPEKRAAYDRLGDEGWKMRQQQAPPGPGQRAGPGFNPFDMFEQMFRQDEKRAIRARISLEEAYRGVQKKFRMTDTEPCMQCGSKCPRCNGAGRIVQVLQMGFVTQTMPIPCDACKGCGATRDKPNCPACKGAGRSTIERFADVAIPAGVPNGARLVVRAMQTEFVVEVEVTEHAVFKRDGDDLHASVELSFRDAVLGKTVTLKHFDGDIVLNTADAIGVVHNGHKHVMRGKGMVAKGRHAPGDLVIRFKVDTHGLKLTPTQRSAFDVAFATL